MFEGWDPADEGRREALCTLGNGRFATRGAAPESVADGVHYPGTYAAGCYNRLRDEIGGQVVENESMVNLPNWLDLRFAIDGRRVGRPLAGARCCSTGSSWTCGADCLSRELRFADAGRADAPRCASVGSCTWDSRSWPDCTRVFTAENWSGRLRVASGIDGAVTNAGVPRYAAWRSVTSMSLRSARSTR